MTESDLLLVQVSNENNTRDLASLVTSRRIGEYEVEGVIVGDERSWSRATWDIISRNDVDNLVTASTSLANPSLYAMILEPLLDMMP